jgi:hypothetical protein
MEEKTSRPRSSCRYAKRRRFEAWAMTTAGRSGSRLQLWLAAGNGGTNGNVRRAHVGSTSNEHSLHLSYCLPVLIFESFKSWPTKYCRIPGHNLCIHSDNLTSSTSCCATSSKADDRPSNSILIVGYHNGISVFQSLFRCPEVSDVR